MVHALETEVREYDRLFLHEAPDSQTEDFSTFVNPESLKVRKAFVEPHIKNASVGEQFQFQRIGYFNVDNDSTATNLVFNKTVGLRDAWTKNEPKPTQPANPQAQSQAPKRKAIDVIKQLGKKYTNLPEEKQQKVKAEILLLSKEVSYKNLEPLFNTAAKKVGTRIAVALMLKVLLENGLEKNDQIDAFIATAKTDAHPLLSEAADQI
jgi:glutaminyl-tRNA synthetase